MALPKTYRLRHRREFTRVYRDGIRHSTPHLILRALRLPNSSDNVTDDSVTERSPRIGVSISQKVSKKAVTRNRIKRQIQSAMQRLLPRMSKNWQVVVVVRPRAMQCDYSQFLQELEQLLTEAEIINGH
ncbi:MAG: ribonuclease P protein component [Elainellaceae cyanobacterium]